MVCNFFGLWKTEGITVEVLKRARLEVALSVEEEFSGDFENASNYVPTAQECRTSIKDYLEEAGLARRKSALFRIRSAPSFIEFDSSNPSHACAYYGFEVEAPTEIIDRILE